MFHALFINLPSKDVTLNKHIIITSLESLHKSPIGTEISHMMIDSIDRDKLPWTPEDEKFVGSFLKWPLIKSSTLKGTQIPTHME